MCVVDPDAGWKITLTSEDTSVGDIRERIYTIDGRWQCDPEWKCIPFRRDHFTASRRQQHPVERAPNRYVLEIYLPMGHGYIFMSLYSIGLCSFFCVVCVRACVMLRIMCRKIQCQGCARWYFVCTRQPVACREFAVFMYSWNGVLNIQDWSGQNVFVQPGQSSSSNDALNCSLKSNEWYIKWYSL